MVYLVHGIVDCTLQLYTTNAHRMRVPASYRDCIP